MKLLALLLCLPLAVCAAPVQHSTEKALDAMLQAKRELLASSETNFFIPDSETRVRFIMAGAQAVSMQHYEDGGDAGPIYQRSHH